MYRQANDPLERRSAAKERDRGARPEATAAERGFVSLLDGMTPTERISASRHGGFSGHERAIWAARFPDEVPLLNGEFEWIAGNLE